MIDKELIRDIVEKNIADTPMFLVDIQINAGNCIVVEVDSDASLGIDDCIVLSKKIESELDRDAEDFELEVGSAGLTSPFKVLRQYEKYTGKDVEVLLKGGTKISGVLKSSNEKEFIVTITKMVKPEGAKRKMAVEEDLIFAYEEVKYTKYIISFK